MIITGTYDLVVDPQWRNVQQQEVFLECDTKDGQVEITLFEIVELNRFWNVKIIISDYGNNASVNNIIINASNVDKIDQDGTVQIILNNDGESVTLQPVSENNWIALQSVSGGASKPLNWDLIQGEGGLGGDPRVFSGLTAIPETETISGTNLTLHNLKAQIDFDGSSNIYTNYIGVITVDLATSVQLVANQSVFVCDDSGLTGKVTSIFTNGAWVQNTTTGASEQIPFVIVNPDNTIGNPNEYYLFLLTGNPNSFQGTANLDITFSTDSTSVTYNQNV